MNGEVGMMWSPSHLLLLLLCGDSIMKVKMRKGVPEEHVTQLLFDSFI